MVVTAFLLVVLLLLGSIENYLHQKKIKQVPVRILVNGTRGKTTLARLLVSSLNAAGIRTLGRTTGSEASVIYPDGHVEPFVRKRAASILEMKRVFSLAQKEGVDAIVMECMALSPENQKAISRHLVKPTHVLISNTFVDHVVEMGPTLSETVYALSQSVPRNARLYVTEDHYKDVSSRVLVVREQEEVPFHTPFRIPPALYSLAKAFLLDLGVDDKCIREGLGTLKPDIGLHSAFYGEKGALLIPTFSVNDLTCMDQTVKDAIKDNPGKEIQLIYNNRQDREYRIQLMDRVIGRNREGIAGVIVIGDYTWKVKTWFRRLKVPVRSMETRELFLEIQQKTEDTVYVGLGNIKGKGEELLKLFLEGEKDA